MLYPDLSLPLQGILPRDDVVVHSDSGAYVDYLLKRYIQSPSADSAG